MFQTQLPAQIVDWERRLEIEEENRKYHRSEAYVNYLAAPQDCRTERPSGFAPLLARVFQFVKERGRKQRQPMYRSSPPECCPETRFG